MSASPPSTGPTSCANPTPSTTPTASSARALAPNISSQQTSGLGYVAKLGLAAAVKFTPLNPQKQKVYKVDFQVDPRAPEGVRDIEGYAFVK